MIGYLFPTDLDCFTFLRMKQPLDEVNFWRPSGRALGALAPEEPLLFKLKSPLSAIGGFGLFTQFEKAPAQLAWAAFGERNGAATFDRMYRRIEHYRAGQASDPLRRHQIGCIMLSKPTFFEEGDWIPQPTNRAPQAVSGAGYHLDTGEGLRVWSECLRRAAKYPSPPTANAEVGMPTQLVAEAGPRYGAPRPVTPTLGQGTFRIAVTSAYGQACAVTGEHSLPALEAAHILPFADDGPRAVLDGLLLRAEVHRLFDSGYVRVTPDLRFVVSDRFQREFANGEASYERQGVPIEASPRRLALPDPELLRWHNEKVFEQRVSA